MEFAEILSAMLKGNFIITKAPTLKIFGVGNWFKGRSDNMITVESEKNIQNRVGDYRLFEFRGLSGDEKPTDTYKSIKIANGSVFIEMDTEDVLFYDEEAGEWVGGDE